jgi:hypothetical protein
MNWRKILTILAVIVAGILVYTLYLYLGPYRKVAREGQGRAYQKGPPDRGTTGRT